MNNWSLIIAALLAWSSSCLCAQHTQPLMTRSEAISQLFRLNPPIYGVLETESSYQFEVSRTFANLWARDKRFLIDAELIDDRARLAFSPLSWLRLGLGINSRKFGQTRTDQVAISFHDLMMIGQDGRLEAGKHHTRFKIPDYNLEFGQIDRNQIISEQIMADITWALLESSSWRISATLLTSYEMAKASPYAEGAVDWGWQLNGSYPWGSGAAFAAVTQLNFDRQALGDVPTQKQQLGWSLGTAQTIEDAHEFVGQMMVYQPVFRQLGQLSRNSYETQLGYRYRWKQPKQTTTFEAVLIENIFWLYNSPDWGLSLGMRSEIF